MATPGHAAYVAGLLQAPATEITLLTIIPVEAAAKGEDLSKEAQRSMDEAKALFEEAGVPGHLVSEKTRTGDAAEEIIAEAEEGNYGLVIVGRKGRSAIKDLILGGVSTSVIERCTRPTVAVVTSK